MMIFPKKVLTGLLVAGILAVGLSVGGSVYAAKEEQKAATQVAKDYVAAFEKHDTKSMLKYVKDTRAKEATELQAMYEQLIKENDMIHGQMKLDRVESLADGKFQAIFEMKTDLNKKGWAQYPLPMVKEDGEWKVFVDGSLIVDTKN
ncbi:NTF2-like N-terminal transpeptidase domain-containing protein [Tumebacillus permanentifrigoris]|uniref:MecA-like transpeptidase family protein n=1 Tax=Tumebacillus permanentifrigoris TaxID=378543 RepID=A0A316DB21_9BACL|nr:NTF2-like N-terminal transpeptidase domain-containing protein [Tumebacillus permanentifrigoris]PWK14805.1 MecA-like transpeptidase family protein [Tumebacillus permanentifrigoris]